MIYSQQTKSEVKHNQQMEQDNYKYNVEQLQNLKNQEIQERREFLYFMSDHIQNCLDQERQYFAEDVFQTIKNLIVRMGDKPFWILEDLLEDFLQQLESQIDDYIVLNQVKLIISSFNAQYSNKFNQITTHHLQNLMKNQNSKKQQYKRISHYIEVHELIPNQKDRFDEINQLLLSFIQTNENFVCPDSWLASFCHAFGIFLFKKDSSSTFYVKKLNIDVIQIDTYGIDQETAKNLYFLLPDYEVILPQLLSTINVTKGNFQHTLSNIYDFQVKAKEYPNPFLLKGKGIICCNNEGFQVNELITFYFGELYTPQRWFEKQTIFHKRMQDGNKKNCQQSPFAEFYINDDLLFIDPTRYGNMAQHISYSCEPNCRLVTIVINSQNFLAVLTSKKIQYLEELTLPFPQTSIDQCLCGSIFCKRQQQLDTLNNRLMQIYPNYIQRNVILLKSTVFNNWSQSVELPYWLSNWEKMNSQQDHFNIKSCVDKVKFVLNRLKITQPPIFMMNNTIEIFWKKYDEVSNKNLLDQSIMSEIKIFLNRHFELKQCKLGLNIITKMKKIIDENYEYAMQLTRMLLLILSEILLSIEACKFNNEALSTILYFMSFTHTYFQSTQYQGFESKPFDENEFDYIPQPKNKSKLPLSKLYTPQFIWGQLINWNKQTLQNPQSSMAQERRGTLCYPSLLLSFDNKHKLFPYQCKTRSKFLEYFQTKREIQPDLSTWSYKNQYNFYGTIFFEQYFSVDTVGECFISKITNLGTKLFKQKFQYWLEVEYNFSKDQQMIDCLNKIYQNHFSEHLESIPKKQVTKDFDDTDYTSTKKIKYNNEGTMIEETQFGSY